MPYYNYSIHKILEAANQYMMESLQIIPTVLLRSSGWRRAGTRCLFSQPLFFERITADKVALAPLSTGMPQMPPSQYQQGTCKTRIFMEHYGCLMESWIIISTMTINMNFFWTGGFDYEATWEPGINKPEDVISRILLECVEKYHSGKYNHQEWSLIDTTSKRPQQISANLAVSCAYWFQYPHHLYIANCYSPLRHDPAHRVTGEISSVGYLI